MKVSQKLYALRKKYDMKQEDIARIAEVSVSAVSGWEKEIRSPKVGAIAKLCDYFRIPLNVFIDPDNDIYDSDYPANLFPMPQTKRIPLIGEVCAGEGTIANPEFEEYVTAPDWVHADFALKCKGDSMTGARIYDGDMVYIRRQETVEPGEIAAVQIGEEALLKRVYFSGETIILQPENPQYAPIIVNPNESGFHIIGKAIAFTSTIV